MSEHPDENNLKCGWLARTRFEEERKRHVEEQRLKFEEDKARKRKDACSPWPAEAWQAARARLRAGVKEPEPRFPIIITDFMTPQKVQELAGLSSLPEMGWTTTTGFDQEELDHPEKLQYCVVTGRGLFLHLKEITTGEKVRVWFEGEKRIAWSAHEQRSGDDKKTDV